MCEEAQLEKKGKKQRWEESRVETPYSEEGETPSGKGGWGKEGDSETAALEGIFDPAEECPRRSWEQQDQTRRLSIRLKGGNGPKERNQREGGKTKRGNLPNLSCKGKMG